MDGVGLKSHRNDKYKEKFWDKVQELEKKDPDIALELKKGNIVKI